MRQKLTERYSTKTKIMDNLKTTRLRGKSQKKEQVLRDLKSLLREKVKKGKKKVRLERSLQVIQEKRPNENLYD